MVKIKKRRRRGVEIHGIGEKISTKITQKIKIYWRKNFEKIIHNKDKNPKNWEK